MSEEKIPYSVHSFMLPFRWDYIPPGFKQGMDLQEIDFDTRTNLKNFYNCLCGQNSFWQRKFFKIDGKAENFNEQHYFHAYASLGMYDMQQESEQNPTDIAPNKAIVYYEMETDPQTDTYTIRVKNKKDYVLALAGISMHVYTTGVAILTFNLENYTYTEKEHILHINEFGRRIYPQFLTINTIATDVVKDSFLAESIEIYIAKAGLFADDFSEYEKIDEREVFHYNAAGQYIKSWVIQPPKYIRDLLGEKFVFKQADEIKEKVRFNILTDDRMFFQCWYGNDELAKELAIKKIEGKKDDKKKDEQAIIEPGYTYPYLSNSSWYCFIFGDKESPSSTNPKMMLNEMEKHTYARWAGGENYKDLMEAKIDKIKATIYGFSKDSFVNITDRSWFSENVLRIHMKTMYYQVAVINLAQRASVLRFSREVTYLSDLNKHDNKKLIANIKTLYKNYIEFINKIYFREITPYIQGTEMYNQFQGIMELEKNIKDLDDELGELFNYVKLDADEKQGDEAHRLSVIASWFLPASFIASLFGIGYMTAGIEFTGKPEPKLWIAWGIICVGGALISWILFKIFKKKK